MRDLCTLAFYLDPLTTNESNAAEEVLPNQLAPVIGDLAGQIRSRSKHWVFLRTWAFTNTRYLSFISIRHDPLFQFSI